MASSPLAQHQQIKALACFPCAKRKVRCDRKSPCSNCKRRKGDVCEYPRVAVFEKTPSQQQSSERIERLESYIRSLGGNLNDVKTEAQVQDDNVRAVAKTDADQTSAAHGAPRAQKGAPSTVQDIPHGPASLVEHERQSVYIELPMWYSFSEAQRAGDDVHKNDAAKGQLKGPSRSINNVTLLDPFPGASGASSPINFPSSTIVQELWRYFLRNVHPLVKIFFSWEKEPMIAKLAHAPTTLTEAERALSWAVLFIATFSISDDEASSLMHEDKTQVLDALQAATEAALRDADFTCSTNCQVLQAFILYMHVMRDRAKPGTNYCLMGVATRMAERLGIHRDGAVLGLSVYEAELRRRIWWQMQMVEMALSKLTGCLPSHIYSEWDAGFPANLDDDDIHHDTTQLPADRPGLTSMSQCLWRYRLLHMQRTARKPDGSREMFTWAHSAALSVAEKDRKIDAIEAELGDRFLRHCEPLEPLHLLIQVGVRSLTLAARQCARQERVVGVERGSMSPDERRDMLDVSCKCLEYNVYGATNELISRYRWHNDSYFQLVAFVFIVVEARHCDARTGEKLWDLIDRVCDAFPKLTREGVGGGAEGAPMARLLLASWRSWEETNLSKKQDGASASAMRRRPRCIERLQEDAAAQKAAEEALDAPMDDDFDWSFGGQFGMDAGDAALWNLTPLDWSFLKQLG